MLGRSLCIKKKLEYPPHPLGQSIILKTDSDSFFSEKGKVMTLLIANLRILVCALSIMDGY